jgi:hypothetical protein
MPDLMAAENRGPLMHARIGMLRALNRNVERVFNPDSTYLLPHRRSSFFSAIIGEIAARR